MVIEREHVVPVTADLHTLLARLVPSAGLRAAHRGQGLGKQRVLERLGNAPLLGVEAPVLGGHLLEPNRELLGAQTPSDQARGKRGRTERKRDANDRDDPPQSLRQRSRPGRGALPALGRTLSP